MDRTKLMLASEQTHKAYADNSIKLYAKKMVIQKLFGVVIMSLQDKHISSPKEIYPKV